MRTVALDLGARKICFCEVSEGRVIDRATVRKLSELESRIGPNTPPARVAFEACRTGWHVHKMLGDSGHEPWMVDTTRLAQVGVGQHGRKNDRLDAEALAMALYENRIPLCHVLSEHRQQLRYHLGVRRALVQTRAHLVAQVRELARAAGEKIARCRTEDFVTKVSTTRLTEMTRELVEPLVQVLGGLNERIDAADQKVTKLCQQEPVIQLLSTAPGVGQIVAASVVSVIDEARRFNTAHQVESYLGLVPTEDTSVKRRLGGISKAGNRYARAMLVQAAWCSVRNKKTEDPLALWGKAVAQRRGKNIAAVAVARKLVGILWAMWRDGTPYKPQRLGIDSEQGLRQAAVKLTEQAAIQGKAARKKTRRSQAANETRRSQAANKEATAPSP
jgi:transposase